MNVQPIRLKVLVQQQHWQTHRTFCIEYDKAARVIDKGLIGSGPSRPQLHRWLSGALASLPHPHHCRVLEAMFPDWSVQQLFEPYTPDNTSAVGTEVAQDSPTSLEADIIDEVGGGEEVRRKLSVPHIDSMPNLFDLLGESLEAARGIESEYAGTMAVELCMKAFQNCRDQLRNLLRGQFDAPFDDNWLVYALTERAQRSLVATSVEEVDLEWWQSAAGHTYWRLHKEALRRGIRIQRIFVYRSWTDEHEALARRQRESGVLTLRVHRDQLSPDLRADMILWDESCGYESRVNSSGEAITNNYTFARQDIDLMLDKYRMIESCAEEWPPPSTEG